MAVSDSPQVLALTAEVIPPPIKAVDVAFLGRILHLSQLLGTSPGVVVAWDQSFQDFMLLHGPGLRYLKVVDDGVGLRAKAEKLVLQAIDGLADPLHLHLQVFIKVSSV